ncbi:sulfurtransferase [Vogesella indigofera]|uniref:Sulfurtransferase n=1 Tax=Vogesella indigofera TaxID=45465 RepID=A0ABT5I6W6_VOGIN|nr:sulfurtransferase [Vogesella indigofera]MDC7691914.1 sulfurtransferase [Vogesella indigofera]
MFTTLISASELQQLGNRHTVLLDCRFRLNDPDFGRAAYDEGHLPGAHYLHLDYHLSGPKNGSNGRHPLPDGQRLAVSLGALGISPDTQVVAYDDAGGMYAARAWWLLRWLGHQAVAVLDGGIQAWQQAGGELDTGTPERDATRFSMGTPQESAVTLDEIAANLCTPQYQLVDARAPDRFAGENETLDPVGGHIPGAKNRFFMDNLGSDGRFKPAAQLRSEWLALLDGTPAGQVILSCGSGVTACHNKLALEYAGLSGARLYAGSWSEWCSDPTRPVATGA